MVTEQTRWESFAMSTHVLELDQITVAVPSTVAWDDMEGSRQSRDCSQCRQRVYNLSEMSRGEAEAFITTHSVRSADGDGPLRLCVRFYRRPDGTVMTRDCFALRRAVGRGLMRMAGWVAGLVIVLLGCVLSLG